MKNILTSLIFCFCCLLVNAQLNRFIYLQTENKQPFFVKLDNKILNSYPLGYLIIPKLEDGLYSLVIGFPESNYEEEFNCSIKNKDVGFIIKNAGQKQWQLLNLQTLAVIVPGEVATKPVITYEKETDPFSTMLANVVHDSTLLRKDVSKEIPVEKANDQNQKDSATNVGTTTDATTFKQDASMMSDSGKKDIAKLILPEKSSEIITKDSEKNVDLKTDVTIIKPDTVAIKDASKKDIAKEILPEKPVEDKQLNTPDSVETTRNVWTSKLDKAEIAKTEKINITKDRSQNINPNKNVVALRSIVKRKLKKSNKDGIELMYVDDYGESKDTIRIFIPSEKKKQNDEEIKISEPVTITVTQTEKQPISQQDKQPVSQPEKQPITRPGNKQNITDKTDNKISSPEKEVTKAAVKEPVFITSPMINSDCKNFATDGDFLKIRKKMVAEKNDEDMIKVAKKIFKTKCFTTEQIKNLSVLFLKDEGKYVFFDAAYPFASDSEQYYILEKQLSDAYYITRFKAMIHK